MLSKTERKFVKELGSSFEGGYARVILTRIRKKVRLLAQDLTLLIKWDNYFNLSKTTLKKRKPFNIKKTLQELSQFSKKDTNISSIIDSKKIFKNLKMNSKVTKSSNNKQLNKINLEDDFLPLTVKKNYDYNKFDNEKNKLILEEIKKRGINPEIYSTCDECGRIGMLHCCKCGKPLKLYRHPLFDKYNWTNMDNLDVKQIEKDLEEVGAKLYWHKIDTNYAEHTSVTVDPDTNKIHICSK